MAWLYIPGLTGSHCVADMEGSNWELSDCFQDQEPFALWRGNALQLNTLSKKWKKVPWMLRLSGLMSKPSTASLGVEKWIGSLEDSHANPIQLLENKWEKQIQETCGPILSGSLGKCDQASYSLRMFQMSLECDLIPLSLTSTNWGIMLHGVLWQLPMLEPCTEEGGGSSWRFATPTVIDSLDLPMKKAAKESLKNGNWRGMDLKNSAKLIPMKEVWPTPTTKGWGHASEGQTENLLNKVKDGLINIEEAQSMLNLKDIKNHRTFKQMFPTPTTQGNASVAGQYDKNTGTTLAGFVKMFPTPIAREANEAGGSMERHKRLNRENDSLTRAISGEEGLTQCGKLNPEWVAWLMGLPIGWINCDY